MNIATITAVVERYTYQNPENNYCIVRLQEKGKSDLTTGIGSLPGVPVGSTVRLTGSWENNKEYGPQFKFQQYQLLKPNTLNGLEKYLGSGLIKGIGPKYAARIVKHFGMDTLDIIEHTPEKLIAVHGLGDKRVEKIKKAWVEQKDIQEIMVFLQGEGISSTYAVKIYKHYGKDSINKVKSNPYQLAEDIWGIGFKTADKIASSMGIPAESPLRIKSGILHALSEASNSGHCYLPKEELIDFASKLLEVTTDAVGNLLPELHKEEKITIQEEEVYISSLYRAEIGISSRLKILTSNQSKFPPIDIDKAISWAQEKMGITFAGAQVDTIKTVLTNKVVVLTGGPGTGKSTILKAILLILKLKGVRIGLAAPTGRAAKRMAEVTGEEAKTIHRLLEYDPAIHGFKRNAENPIEADLLIIDEASMLDVVLCNSLLKAVPPEAALLLVGDVDQLPSVGAGSVLKDMIDSDSLPVVRLTHIFRQGEGSLISLNAHNINHGRYIDTRPDYKGNKDFYCIYKDEPEEILSEIISLCKERLPKRYGWNPIKDIQILAPMNRGLIGTGNLNTVLQEKLNPSGASLTRGARIFKVNDKVMQIKNNYDKEVFNGDIGIVKDINEEDQVLVIDFDGRPVEYDYGSELDEIVLAYASSVHKAQGSEYPCVIIPLHTTHFVMLQRNLLYTAVTRGKKLVILVCSKKALAIAIKNSKTTMRNTSLSKHIKNRTCSTSARQRKLKN